MQYRLLCIDLDGTLLDEKKQLSRENIDAVRRAFDNGLQICIASGRTAESAAEYLEAIGITGNVVALNGGQVFSSGIELYRARMKTELVLYMIEIIRHSGVKGFLNNGIGSIVLNGLTKAHERALHEGKLKIDSFRQMTCDEAREAVLAGQETIAKISVQSSRPEELEAVRRTVAAEQNVAMAKSDEDYLDIFTEGQSKWSGIRRLLAHLNVLSEQCVCFGDNENDFEMIRSAGLGIAMGNAQLRIKEAADFLTLKNSEHGVAYGIDTLVLHR